MSKKIVITGGLGYIGTELCKIYSGVSWNNEIIVIDNRFISERVNQIRNWNMEFIHGDILNKENVKFEPKAVAELMNKFFPDWRRVLNELQRYSVSGKIDAGVLVNISESNINELMQSLKDKEFTNVRKWIVHNLDNDAVRIFRRVYDSLYDYMDGSTIPHVVVILAEYQYKASFVSDQEINLLACMTEIMGQAKFK